MLLNIAIRCVLSVFLCIASSTWLFAQQPGTDVVARVAGESITFAEVDDAWRRNDAASRLRMLQELYDTRLRALDILIGERLIEREAVRRGLTRDALLESELPSRTLSVTEEEVTLIYERNRNQFGNRTYEQMAPEIREFIESQRPMQALHAYMNALRRDATDEVTVLLEPPRQNVDVLEEDPSQGSASASVEIVEFSDFDCPYCKRATDILSQVLSEFGEQIRLVYKDYPLPSHPNAFKAAEAGNCANDQGRFWDFHDKMFASQGSLDVPSLKEYAAELGLNVEVFSACLDQGQHTNRVQRDLEIGSAYGVSSTPTLFINGRVVVGAIPYENFVEILREELDR